MEFEKRARRRREEVEKSPKTSSGREAEKTGGRRATKGEIRRAAEHARKRKKARG